MIIFPNAQAFQLKVRMNYVTQTNTSNQSKEIEKVGGRGYPLQQRLSANYLASEIYVVTAIALSADMRTHDS